MASRDLGTSRPLVIVGGGVAGLAAAVEAARGGLTVALLDEKAQLDRAGGRSTVEAGSNGRRELLRELAELGDRVEIHSGTAVLSISEDREVLWAGAGVSGTFRAETIILAPGGSRRIVPFPGWTLPEVLSGGELRDTGEAPPADFAGRRVLVAGTGPFLDLAALRLSELGAEVVAVLYAGTPVWAMDAARLAPGIPGLIGDARSAWATARQRPGIPFLTDCAVVETRERPRIGAIDVTYGPIDPESWRPIEGRAETLDVDFLALDFGDVADNALAILAGCRTAYDEVTGSWLPTRDPRFRTTVPGIFSVGDGAGVAGALVAEPEGRIAGITAAEEAGTMSRAEAERRRSAVLERHARLARTRAMLEEASQLRPGLLAPRAPETILCRCEGIAVGSVLSALEEGARDLASVKMLTRLGMGSCQGKECGLPAMRLVCSETGLIPDQVGRINPRPPARSVTLGALARMADGLPVDGGPC